MALTRSFLKELGVEADTIDKIMEAHGSAMSQRLSKQEADEQTQLQVALAKKEWEKDHPAPVKATETEEYKKLLGEYNGLILDGKLAKYKVKDKFREIVKSKIDAEKLDDSIKSLKENYAEFFEPDESAKTEAPASAAPAAPVPSFGGESVKGDNPSDSDRILAEISKRWGV